jgi:Cytochrome b/b6/petB
MQLGFFADCGPMEAKICEHVRRLRSRFNLKVKVSGLLLGQSCEAICEFVNLKISFLDSTLPIVMKASGFNFSKSITVDRSATSKNLSFLKQPVLSVVNEHLIAYPTPSNLNYFWGFGSLAGICLVIQIATGVFLAMHYCPEVNLAFNSVEHIMREVSGGYILRYAHANGASLFFLVVMVHILRGLYYGSYYAPREAVWIIGVIILFLMVATAFIGYALPFGQQSLWGISVITSLFSVVPFVGNDLVQWLWGGLKMMSLCTCVTCGSKVAKYKSKFCFLAGNPS